MRNETAPIQTNPKGCRIPLALLSFAAVIPLMSCQPRGAGVEGAAARGQPAAEAAYHPPPRIQAVESLASGGLVLSGQANPGASVRLASPNGVLTPAVVDGRGGWRVHLLLSDQLRLFGLAAVEQGRTVQAEGYVALSPDGEVAQLRAGAGAIVLTGRGGLRIHALDYDRKGGAIVSGEGPAGAAVTISCDDTPRARGVVDADGRFSLTLDEPVSVGAHRLQVTDAFGRSGTEVTVSPPAPLTGGPYRAVHQTDGWRIDWLTPGGGVQTTILMMPTETPQ